MDFFNKYKRAFLYGITFFVLIVFSVTGAMVQVFHGLFAPKVEFGTITLEDGRTVELSESDEAIGRLLLAGLRPDPVPSLPPLFPGEHRGEDDSDEARRKTLAILRRAALEWGLDVPRQVMAEAKRTGWEAMLQQGFTPAGFMGLPSERDYDAYLREAGRVALLVRLGVLGADLSDLALMEHVRREQRRTSYSFVAFSTAPAEERLAAEPLTDEELQEWLDGLEPHERSDFQDQDRVALEGIGLLLEEFDREDFAEELQDYVDPVVEDLRNRYERDRATLYLRTPPAAPGPTEEDAPQEGPPAPAPAEGPGDQEEFVGPPTEEQVRYRPFEEVQEEVARRLRMEAALSALLSTLRSRAEAEEDFKLEQWIREEAQRGGRAGVVFVDVPAPLGPDELADVDERLGEWLTPWVAQSLEAGDFSAVPQATRMGAFVFRVTDVVRRPIKPLDEIREEVLKQRARKLAMEEVRGQGEEFVEELRRKARERAPEEVEEVRARKEEEIASKVAEWRSEAEAALEQARAALGRDIPRRARRERERQVAELQEQLAGEGPEPAIRARIEEEFEEEFRRISDAHAAEVFEALAAEQGLEVRRLEAVRADEAGRPGYEERYPDPLDRFVVSRARDLEGVQAGRVSEPLESHTDRAFVVVRVDERAKPEPSEISRREFLQARHTFHGNVLRGALQQGFSPRAVKARYRYGTPAPLDLE